MALATDNSVDILQQRIDNANRLFRRKAAEVFNDEDSVRLLARLYQAVVIDIVDFDSGKEGIALAKLTAANFCEIGAKVIYITESGQRFIKAIEANDSPAPNPLDVPARLNELRAMRDGWLEGGGKAPSQEGLGWLSESFKAHFPKDLPLPFTYPTPEGGIEMEWSLGAHSIVFEIDIDARQGDWLQFEKESEDEDSRSLDLDDGGAWAWLVREVRRLTDTVE